MAPVVLDVMTIPFMREEEVIVDASRGGAVDGVFPHLKLEKVGPLPWSSIRSELFEVGVCGLRRRVVPASNVVIVFPYMNRCTASSPTAALKFFCDCTDKCLIDKFTYCGYYFKHA